MFVAIVIGLLFLTFVLALYVFFKQANRKGFEMKELQYIRSHWVRIIDMFSNNPKESILDADKLLDYALDRSGYKGSVGEKLKISGARFSDIDGLWRAHKLRNQVAHELGNINIGDAKKALSQFKRALNDLGAGL